MLGLANRVNSPAMGKPDIESFESPRLPEMFLKMYLSENPRDKHFTLFSIDKKYTYKHKYCVDELISLNH